MNQSVKQVGWLGTLLLFVSAATAGGAVPNSESDFHYYYFKRPIALELDPARVAVLIESAEGGPGSLPTLNADELAEKPLAPLAVKHWYFAAMKPEQSTTKGVQSVASRLARQGATSFTSPVFAASDGSPLVVTPQILVAFQPNIQRAQAEAILTEMNAGAILNRDWANMAGAYRVKSAARDGFAVLDHVNALARRSEVIYAEPDFIITGRGSFIPNDPLFGDAWGIHNTGQSGGTPDADMDGPEAWDITTGDPSIKVLIIDVGVEQTHPDINQLPGADVTSDGPGGGGNPINACDNHGTPVAGCVSAIINNALGTMGIAPACKSVSVRFAISNSPCNGTWSGFSSWTVDALAFGESMGVRVTNNSNYYPGLASASIETKYAQTRTNGMVHFASAGNDAVGSTTYPSSLPTVNAIAALERHGNRAGFSNWGADLFASAPGQTIISTDRTGAAGYVSGDYVFIDGTSFASPYTAGVAALVLSINTALPSSSVESILASGAVDLGVAGWDSDFGWGFINAHRAIVLAQGGCNETGPPDCNNNGLTDECDLFDGTSQDCNSNSIPDECESAADCQSNGTADICDIAAGISFDCNANTVPDECDLLGASLDCNTNLIPDECDSTAVEAIINDRPAAFGYINISASGTPLNLGDDDSATVVVPFSPPSLPSTSARISNNGAIGFGTTANVANPNTALPSSDLFAFAAALAAYWDDLDSTTGNVYYQTLGNAPDRNFIVQWHNRPHYPGDAVIDGDEVTFQIQIFETPVQGAVAQFIYVDTTFGATGLNQGRSATVGYQRDSQSALLYSFNVINSIPANLVLTLMESDCQGNGVPDSCEWAAGAEDCNSNQVIDVCDISREQDPDCNDNADPDSCDISSGFSLDTDLNGIPDECDVPQSAVADPSGIGKSRFLSFSVPASQTAAGNSSALRVLLDSLHHVSPPYSGGPSVPFTSFEGQYRWVGPPVEYTESASGGTSFYASVLQCTPHYQDWTTVGLLHVTGSAVVPSSVYAVENVAANCMGNEAGCFAVSEPLAVSTTRWGDVETPYNPPSPSTQPDLGDVSALVNKFRSAPGAPIKARALLVGGDSIGTIDIATEFSFVHIAACVDAFRGRPYPHTIEACP